MANHNNLGKAGEQKAMNYLIQKGYQIEQINWRFHKYEIDIIAKKGDLFVFVEVKSRSTSIYGNPEEFISKGQQKRIITAANEFLMLMDDEVEARFDVIAIIENKWEQKIEHIKDAFAAFD